jgi:hypothetical protein
MCAAVITRWRQAGNGAAARSPDVWNVGKGPAQPAIWATGIAAGGTALRGLGSGYRQNHDRGLKNLPQLQVLAKFNLQKCTFQ